MQQVWSMTSKDPLVVACIPAYCEENTIAGVVLSAQEYVDKIIVCDDGSTDMTGKIAEKLGAIVVRHNRNQGKGQAIKTLLETATKLNADIIVLIDADGQHNPNDIPNLIKPILESKADLVLGSRYANQTKIEAPLYRRLGLRLINYLDKKINKLPVADAECGFRALSKKALQATSFFEHTGYGVDVEMLSLAKKNGINIVEIPVVVKYRGLKKTSKKKPLLHGGELIANLLRLVMEERPLLYAGVPATVLLLIGISAAVYLVVSFNSTRTLSLHSMVIAVGSSLGGLLLGMTAIILYSLKRINSKITDFENRSLHKKGR